MAPPRPPQRADCAGEAGARTAVTPKRAYPELGSTERLRLAGQVHLAGRSGDAAGWLERDGEDVHLVDSGQRQHPDGGRSVRAHLEDAGRHRRLRPLRSPRADRPCPGRRRKARGHQEPTLRRVPDHPGLGRRRGFETRKRHDLSPGIANQGQDRLLTLDLRPEGARLLGHGFQAAFRTSPRARAQRRWPRCLLPWPLPTRRATTSVALEP